MEIKETISDILEIFGACMLLWIFFVGVHEYGHYRLWKDCGVPVTDICVFGVLNNTYWNVSSLPLSYMPEGWVSYWGENIPNGCYQKNIRWDCWWTLGLEKKYCG